MLRLAALLVGLGLASAFHLPSPSIHTPGRLNAATKDLEDDLRKTLAEKNEDLEGRNIPTSTLKEFVYDNDAALLEELRKDRPYFSVVAEKAAEAFDSILSVQKDDQGTGAPTTPVKTDKPRIVILGTGWGSHAMLKSIDATKYDVTTVSPNNFFLFTPMLAASAVGTVEYRSITEPIRKVNPAANYVEATATEILLDQKQVVCENVVCEGTSCKIQDVTLPYDYLVVAVGATSNTFGIPGVREHCIFLKQITDAQKLRKAIGNCFERASVPNMTEEERIAVLTFVVVGAGPTGVEFVSELRDFIEEDAPKFYPELLKDIRIKLVEASDKVLMAFDQELQQQALADLTARSTSLVEKGLISKEMTEVLLKVGVQEVTDTMVKLSDGSTIPYGLAVWAAGNGPLPVVLDMIENVPDQSELASWGRGRIVVDDWLRVKGAENVFALGDCAVVDKKPLPQTAQVAAQQGTYLGRLFSRDFEVTAPVPQKKLRRLKMNQLLSKSSITLQEADPAAEPTEAAPLSEKLGLSVKGKYAKPFQFLNLGILAYTGSGKALAQVQVDETQIKGTGGIGFWLWRSVYLSKQVSWRNRALVAIDWAKTKVFGRDITRWVVPSLLTPP
ncbi:unnamed protein product [Chrysoparadoxa australica]